jgi:hypothetical protein
MPTAMVIKQGHCMELIVRNQDDYLSHFGGMGVHHLPHMQTVTHEIHLGKSYLLMPYIPYK